VAPLRALSPGADSPATDTVTVEGRGPTVELAMEEAFKWALLEVNGIYVDTASLVPNFHLDTEEDAREDLLRSDSFAQEVTERSEGLITKFQLLALSLPTGANGLLYRVRIRASIANFDSGKDAKHFLFGVAPARLGHQSIWPHGVQRREDP